MFRIVPPAVIASSSSDTDVALMIGVIAGVLLLLVVISVAIKGKREKRYCPTCGHVGPPAKKYGGSDALSIFLLIFAFPIWLIYEIIRATGPKWVCRVCGRPGMIPANSPNARRAISASRPQAVQAAPADGPGWYAVWGVNRQTGMDTSLYVEAQSRANAHVKAELRGVTATAIEKYDGGQQAAGSDFNIVE